MKSATTDRWNNKEANTYLFLHIKKKGIIKAVMFNLIWKGRMEFTRFMGQDKQFSTKKRHEHEFQKTGEQLIQEPK